MRSTTLLFVLLLAAAPAMAVDTLQVHPSDPVLASRRWTEFDRNSGLVGGVYDILEDRDGNIWFATDKGVQRYDGYLWTTYTTEDGLSANQVHTLIQTQDGSMWFGTNGGGISRFDGETWTTYTMDQGLASNAMRRWGLHQTRDGTLWAGFQSSTTLEMSGGISRFDGQTWTTVEVPVGPPRPNIRDIRQTSDGSLWFTTHDNGVLRLDGTTWTRYTSEDGMAGDDVWQMLESSDGSIWFTCYRDGICRFDGKRWRTYTAGDGLPEGASFFSVFQTEDGTVWATGDRTFCRFDGERWKTYGPEEISLFRWDLFGRVTRDGSIWFWEWNQEKAFRFDFTPTKLTVYPDVPSAILERGQAADGLFTIGSDVWLGGTVPCASMGGSGQSFLLPMA